jgi:large subunit ribosomal protein L25
LAKGITQGGKLVSNLRRLKVKAIAKNLPDTIDLDVEGLGIGDSIKVGDIKIENLEVLNNKSNVIVSVNVTRVAKAAMAADGDTAEEGEGEGEAEKTES